MTNTHEKVLAFIKAVRESFPDAAIIFTHGACYGLFEILNQAFPSQPYITADSKHVVTRIDGRFYDISGEFLNSHGEVRECVSRMTKQQREYWKSVSSGQRVEYMLRKYNSDG